MTTMNDNDFQPEGTMDASFADLFEADGADKEKQLAPGQKVKARVVTVGEEWIFLDVGRKSEGCLARHELTKEDGQLSVRPGDEVEAYFLAVDQHEMLFTTKIGGSASLAHLEEAFRSNIPVEGLVKEEIKGGFAVMISGSTRAFCPYSQMDIRRVGDAADYVDQHYTFKIIEFSENGRNILVSRRVLLEEERQLKKEALQQTLQPGMAISGQITSIREFGAFVDIGGIEGLIPISEIGWGRTEDIHEIITEGQEVEVVALKLDWDNDRFSFSLKQTLPNPWDNVFIKYPVGTIITGTVARLTQFGAFVTLEPGLDGLIHISNLGQGKRINHPREVVDEGQTIEVRIDAIDSDKKRLSLALAAAGPDDAEDGELSGAETKQYLQSHSKPSSGATAFGDLLKAKMAEKQKK